MTDSVENPTHDPSADEELSSSLEGHSELPQDGSESSVLDEADDSPVRAKNS